MGISGKLYAILRLLAANAGKSFYFLPRVAAFLEAATRGYFYWTPSRRGPLVFSTIFNYLQYMAFVGCSDLKEIRGPMTTLT